ncbi:hypothetical protein CDAR_428901 [Caerostris darwini]|uniref:Uncharacterized protein n=1 Tax=Caerostris darwini TaxID=1538125 RepID=A0AAV4V564_9ARAC|nr:hypothetical protein CDAR_428901 [Caerostris darwini]
MKEGEINIRKRFTSEEFHGIEFYSKKEFALGDNHKKHNAHLGTEKQPQHFQIKPPWFHRSPISKHRELSFLMTALYPGYPGNSIYHLFPLILPDFAFPIFIPPVRTPVFPPTNGPPLIKPEVYSNSARYFCVRSFGKIFTCFRGGGSNWEE